VSEKFTRPSRKNIYLIELIAFNGTSADFACFQDSVPKQQKKGVDMSHDNTWKIIQTISVWLLASVLFLLIMLGWLGDSLLSLAIRRPRLSFHEVYDSWKRHHLRHVALSKIN
jgi:hypothetical protein